MKKIIYFIAVLALMCACNSEEPNPYREALEQFAKENISNPDSYEFDYMGIEKEYQYWTALAAYREKLQKEAEQPGADIAAIKKADDKIQEAFEAVKYNVACYEESLHFWYKGGQDGSTRMQGVVVARYDADRNLIVMTMNPDTLPAEPALQMLRDKGYLE